MYQGPILVDEYFKEMEVTLIRAQIVKSQEVTMARFLSGLNRAIWDIVELHDYTSISILLNPNLRAMEKKSYPTNSSNLRGKERNILKWDKSPRKRNAPLKGNKEEVSQVYVPNSNTYKFSNIKCFKCFGKGHMAS
ncbi:hypothetical protein CR513_02704, partial [Mucuna pruriens]